MNPDFSDILSAFNAVPPRRIDLMTTIDGVDFDSAWLEKLRTRVAGIEVPTISRQHLLVNKRATGRPQDLADVARLMELGGDNDL